MLTRRDILPDVFAAIDFTAHVMGTGLAHGFVMITFRDKAECGQCGGRHYQFERYNSATQPADVWNYAVRWGE